MVWDFLFHHNLHDNEVADLVWLLSLLEGVYFQWGEGIKDYGSLTPKINFFLGPMVMSWLELMLAWLNGGISRILTVLQEFWFFVGWRVCKRFLLWINWEGKIVFLSTDALCVCVRKRQLINSSIVSLHIRCGFLLLICFTWVGLCLVLLWSSSKSGNIG